MKKWKENLASASFIIGAVAILFYILVTIVGADLSIALASFFNGIFGSVYSVGEVLVKTVPLLLAGLGVSVAFRTGIINLGAEGQIYMGAIAAGFCALLLPGLPWFLMIPVCLLSGFLLGGIWSMIPGFLKAKFGISEVINTIMFNYISIYIVGILVRTILQDPNNAFPMSASFPESSWLPIILTGSRLHFGLVIAIVLMVAVWLLMWRTKYGFEMRAVGENQRASACSGISVNKNILLSSLISGGLAGIAGVCEVTGLHHKLMEGISPNYGYLAIIVALLGRNHPFGVFVSALGLAMLQVGSLSMQRSAGIPTSISSIILAAIVLLILAQYTIFKKWNPFKKKEV